MNKKIAVLLASYNGIKYIKEQIDSILNQKNVDVTIFISDDLSTDHTLEFLVDIYRDNNRLVYLEAKQKFGGAALNFFRLIKDVDFSEFDYISLADQDDIWFDNKIISSIETIENSDIDVYSSNVRAFWANGKKILINKSHTQKKYDYLFSSAGPGCTYVMKRDFLLSFKKELILKESLLTEVELHDWLIYSFARANNYKWFTDNNVTMLYRQHQNNEFGANSGLSTLKKRWNKSRNGWYRKQILNVASFCNIRNDVIEEIEKNTYVDRIKLALNVFNFRRKNSEAVVLFFMLLVPGFK